MAISRNTLIGILLAAVATVTVGSMIASGSLGVDVVAACSEPDGPERQQCLEKSVLDRAETEGPVAAIDTLKSLLADGTMAGRGDYHDFVHRIGRLTAKKNGLNPDAFFLCPLDFNYGCQHGFFEQALVLQPDPLIAADMICDPSRMTDRPLKFLFYCYHGVGHGVMMAQAYDLQRSLDICDRFPDGEPITGCYQGVFMESVVGNQNGTARTGLFSPNDKLSPCNKVDEKYRSQCYINLGGYLASLAGKGPGAVERATQPCLAAGTAHREECLRSVGLTSTNEAWQPTLTPAYDPADYIGNAVSICKHFPAGYETLCVSSGLDNIGQFDRGDTTRMVQFCGAFEPELGEQCFRHLAWTVKNELPAGATEEQICGNVPDAYRAVCAQGIAL